MSTTGKTDIIIDVKELSYKSDSHVEDLMRYLAELLPQIDLSRSGNELIITTPKSFSKRILKLRLKKFLHKRKLKEEFRAIALINPEKEGYVIKERKNLQLAYY